MAGCEIDPMARLLGALAIYIQPSSVQPHSSVSEFLIEVTGGVEGYKWFDCTMDDGVPYVFSSRLHDVPG